MGKVIDRTGRRYHRLVAVEHYSGTFWRFRCDCGKELISRVYSVESGQTKSCGCLRAENGVRQGHANRKHGHRAGRGNPATPTYRSWHSMMIRCNNPNHRGYEYWGGRGIRVCERWHQFENFLADMGERPGLALTLDRVDNEGDYEPGNCRWATGHEQRVNSRPTRVRLPNGQYAPKHRDPSRT